MLLDLNKNEVILIETTYNVATLIMMSNTANLQKVEDIFAIMVQIFSSENTTKMAVFNFIDLVQLI